MQKLRIAMILNGVDIMGWPGGNICAVVGDKLHFYYSGCRGNMDGAVNPDGSFSYTPNAGFSGTVRRETSSDTRIAIAGLEWEHEQVMVVEQQVERVDGIVGWVLFEDKVLDIDFGRSEITVRNQLPESIDEWQRNRPGRGARTDLGR